MPAPSIVIVQPRVLLDDPHACSDSSDLLPVFRAVFDTLVRRADQGWQPSAATAWTMSDDARTTTFTLRDDLRFHDGSVCDAAAVQANLERMARPDMGATLGAGGVYAQYLSGMQVATPDSRTVIVTTTEPLADLLDIIGYGHLASPAALQAADLSSRLVGTGPWRFKAIDADRSIDLISNSTAGGSPASHQLRITAQAQPSQRLQALLSGAADVAVGLPAAAASSLSPVRFALHMALAPTAIILMFNCTAGPGADPRVRRALNLATDRPALVHDVLNGLGEPLHGYISRVHDGFDPAAPAWPLDRDAARQLLREAGFGAGLHLQMTCPTRLPDETAALLDALAAQWAGVGVSFTCHPEPDRVAYANQVRTKQIRDICVFDSSPMSAFRVLYEKIDSRVRGSWWEGYASREVEGLLDCGRRTVAFDQRMAIYREAYRALQADPPWVFLYHHHRLVGRAGAGRANPMRRDGILDVRAI
jgi:peptide/nickel transport system substrate-binding protein